MFSYRNGELVDQCDWCFTPGPSGSMTSRGPLLDACDRHAHLLRAGHLPPTWPKVAGTDAPAPLTRHVEPTFVRDDAAAANTTA